MKKIYYLQKIEVELGDLIAYKGFKTTVTEELIELNPELFRVEKNTQPMYFKCKLDSLGFTVDRVYEQTCHDSYPGSILIQDDDNTGRRIYNWQGVRKGANNYGFELTTKEEWDKQELLDKAKRDFPVGTVFRSLFGRIYTVGDKSSYSLGASSILIDSMYIYREGKWAEVLPLKFTTEDGVGIYGDMKTYAVYSDLTRSIGNTNNEGTNSTIKYFYHKENALAYIEKHKEKTLDDYEDILFEDKGTITFGSGGMYFSVYGWLKDNEPKLYYTKILQLIADDLNGYWEPDFNNERQKKWFIDTLGVKAHCSVNYGLAYFKSRELAEKARVILGGKLDCLLN